MNETQEVSIKFNNTITNEKKVADYEKRLRNIYGYINSIKTGQKSAFKDLEKNVISVDDATKETTHEVEQLSKKMNIAFNIKGISEFSKKMVQLGKSIMDLNAKQSSYVENTNLLEVAYSKQSDGLRDYNEQVKEDSKAVKELINQMGKVYGFDESRLTRQFGLFRQLGNAMRLPSETAEQLSEHMVKMANDVASLYNLDLDRASNALQSALTGQPRPIKLATGADVTEKTLQNTVDALGLDKSISQFSNVEKRLIMVISLTEQLKKSQGDYGRTIDSVSNQTRILKEQWDKVGRSVGSIFYPVLKKILPYVNAILMVVSEIASIIGNFIARLLGVNLDEQFDYKNLAGLSDAFLDLEDDINGTGSSVDKLKDKMSGLRGFDKLNVINTPTDSSVSAGAGAGGGINPAIMDAFNVAVDSYDDMLGQVSLKAREIADNILEWLGVTDGTYTNLKLIAGVLGIIGGLEIWNIISTLVKKGGVYKALKKIFDLFKKGKITEKLSSGVTKLSGGFGKLATKLGVTNPVLLAIIAGIALLVMAFINAYKNNEEFRKKVDDLVDTIKTSLKPILDALPPIIDAILKTLKNLWEKVLKPVVDLLFDILTPILEVIIDILSILFETIIKPLTEYFVTSLKPVLNGIFGFINDFIIPIIQGIIDVLKWLWDNILDPLFKFVVKKIEENIIPKIKSIEDVINVIKNAVQKVVDWWNNLSFNKKKIEVEGEGSFGGGSGGGGRANGGVFANGQWHDITAYAGGGLPPVGQMFVAREKGPELVGQINGNTAVMNNDQIVSSVSDGVYRAVSMANKQQSQPINLTLPVEIGGQHLSTIVINDLQNMAKTNGKPIVITG